MVKKRRITFDPLFMPIRQASQQDALAGISRAGLSILVGGPEAELIDAGALRPAVEAIITRNRITVVAYPDTLPDGNSWPPGVDACLTLALIADRAPSGDVIAVNVHVQVARPVMFCGPGRAFYSFGAGVYLFSRLVWAERESVQPVVREAACRAVASVARKIREADGWMPPK